MTIGELRVLLEDLPDDILVMIRYERFIFEDDKPSVISDRIQTVSAVYKGLNGELILADKRGLAGRDIVWSKV